MIHYFKEQSMPRKISPQVPFSKLVRSIFSLILPFAIFATISNVQAQEMNKEQMVETIRNILVENPDILDQRLK